MAEISREAIEYFKKRIESEKQIINLPTCDSEVAEEKKKHISYFEQAIKDRDIVERISKIQNDPIALFMFGMLSKLSKEEIDEIRERLNKNE